MGDMREDFQLLKEMHKKQDAENMQKLQEKLTAENIPFKVLSNREIVLADSILYFPAKNYYQNWLTKKQGRAPLEEVLKMVREILKGIK